MFRLFIVSICLSLLFTSQSRIWFLEGNLLELFKLHRSIDELKDTNQQLRLSNKELDNYLQSVKSDVLLLEGFARYQRNLINNDNEIFYLIK